MWGDGVSDECENARAIPASTLASNLQHERLPAAKLRRRTTAAGTMPRTPSPSIVATARSLHRARRAVPATRPLRPKLTAAAEADAAAEPEPEAGQLEAGA